MHRGLRSATRPTLFRREHFLWLALALLACEPATDTATRQTAEPTVEHGRYLTDIGGCNDCHTDGFMQVGEAIPESDRLLGSSVGFRGPWGTTYPPNLRVSVQNMNEDQWVELLGTRTGLPPMPWPSVAAMSELDRRAIYRYLQALGPAGEVRPVALAPGVEPRTPWIDFNVHGLPMVAD